MTDAPKKLVPRSRLIGLYCLLLGWAAYRLYRDHERDGGWTESSVIATSATVLLGFVIATGIFWYANLPERGKKP